MMMILGFKGLSNVNRLKEVHYSSLGNMPTLSQLSRTQTMHMTSSHANTQSCTYNHQPTSYL